MQVQAINFSEATSKQTFSNNINVSNVFQSPIQKTSKFDSFKKRTMLFHLRVLKKIKRLTKKKV